MNVRAKPLIGCLAGALTAALSFLLGGEAAARDLTLRWLGKEGSVVSERTLCFEDVAVLPLKEIVTTTPWTAGKQTFSGPSISDLAGLVDIRVAEAHVVALNDYSAVIPAADWADRGAILALRLNGRRMEIYEKGPFWIMYPIDSSPELDTQRYRSRMVWQVRSVDFIAD